jgi:glycosyltransferase involved in cell wall biosynthesis
MTNKISICIDARCIIAQHTGIGRYVYNLLNALLKIDQFNEYTALVDQRLERHPILKLKKENFKIERLNIPGVTIRQQVMLPLAIRRKKFDVFHYPNFDFPLAVNFDSVITIHDLTYIKHRNLYKRGRLLKNLYTDFVMRWGLQKVKKIIVVSNSTKHDLVDIFRIPENKIEVIYEAFPDNFTSINKTKTTSKYSTLFNGEPIFLFIGERRPHKNLVRLIEAFYRFKSRVSQNYKLVIAGKLYSNYSEPEALVNKLKLEKDVVFLGYVPDEDLPALYQRADCFVFPSIYEGFGIPILEAMACGTPVITSSVSAMPEVAGGAALNVDPYNVDDMVNAMNKICFDHTLRMRMVEQGYKRATEFSWGNAAEQTLRLYHSILTGN